MEIGLTQPLMATIVVYREKRRPVLRTKNLPSSCADYLEIRGISKFWSAKALSRPVLGNLFNFYLVPYGVDGATRTRNTLRKERDILLLTAEITSRSESIPPTTETAARRRRK
jgi:hypothetical protein